MKLGFPSPEFDDAVAAVCHGSVSDEHRDSQSSQQPVYGQQRNKPDTRALQESRAR